jgi:3-isopropylmalate/(R)-2-methylmalate dehydratase large subunit
MVRGFFYFSLYMPPPKNIIEKIWDTHEISQKEKYPSILGIDLQLLHEITSPQPFGMLRKNKKTIRNVNRTIATIDHSVPTRKNREHIPDPIAKLQIELQRKNTKEFGVPFFDFDCGFQGIVHVIGPELGLTQPGMTIVCGDSHTSTHGAFGALSFGIGTTEVGINMATGCLLQNKPKTMEVYFDGHFQNGVFSKDAALALTRKIGTGGANGYMIEFTGSTVRNMTMEERMTLCNMSIECGARAGVIGPDETTFEYLKGRKYSPKGEEWQRAIRYWKSFRSDKGCSYHKKVTLDVSTLDPMVTWGTTPRECISVTENIPKMKNSFPVVQEEEKRSFRYMQIEGYSSPAEIPIQWVFIGSCTNGRIEDFRIAAHIMKGQKKAKNINVLIVPGSEQVETQMKNEGLDTIFTEFGATVRRPGCSMCAAVNDDRVPPGERCISTSNRNFMNRQGPGALTHLASPATAAASAIKGRIADGRKYFSSPQKHHETIHNSYHPGYSD